MRSSAGGKQSADGKVEIRKTQRLDSFNVRSISSSMWSCGYSYIRPEVMSGGSDLVCFSFPCDRSSYVSGVEAQEQELKTNRLRPPQHNLEYAPTVPAQTQIAAARTIHTCG